MEFDFVEEGITMNAVASFFDRDAPAISGDGASRARSPGTPSVGRMVVVPRCYPELSTRRLLIMDYMEGFSDRQASRA